MVENRTSSLVVALPIVTFSFRFGETIASLHRWSTRLDYRLSRKNNMVVHVASQSRHKMLSRDSMGRLLISIHLWASNRLCLTLVSIHNENLAKCFSFLMIYRTKITKKQQQR